MCTISPEGSTASSPPHHHLRVGAQTNYLVVGVGFQGFGVYEHIPLAGDLLHRFYNRGIHFVVHLVPPGFIAFHRIPTRDHYTQKLSSLRLDVYM